MKGQLILKAPQASPFAAHLSSRVARPHGHVTPNFLTSLWKIKTEIQKIFEIEMFWTRRWLVAVTQLELVGNEKTLCVLDQRLEDFVCEHDDVIKWKHLPRYWPFVRGIHRPPVNSPHKGQWRRALMFFFFICTWINARVNTRDAGDLRHHRAHYHVIV